MRLSVTTVMAVLNTLFVWQQSSSDLVIEDLSHTAALSYSVYNGFLRGLYREHLPHMISTECFGDWIKGNMTLIDQVGVRIAAGEILRIEEEQMREFAEDIVNIVYLNKDRCEFHRIYSEIKGALC